MTQNVSQSQKAASSWEHRLELTESEKNSMRRVTLEIHAEAKALLSLKPKRYRRTKRLL